jgi:hypothetical protein
MILLITTMSIMSGYIGYRAIGDFMRRNRKDLLSTLKPKKGILPSFDVVREVLIALDFKEFSKQFYNWSKQYVAISKNEWVSMDDNGMKKLEIFLINYILHDSVMESALDASWISIVLYYDCQIIS